MGLDMYLNRMPRWRNANANNVEAVQGYLDWQEKCKDPNSRAKDYTLREWCGIDEKDIISESLEFYRHFYDTKYWAWDTEHAYPHRTIIDQVGYWRKANAIHDWFVRNVQDGEDDCHYHNEVTKEILEELLDICETVLASCELVDGKINNGYTYENGQKKAILDDGKYVKDPSVAMKLLPTTCGFFFGSEDYDEYYVEDIKDTIDIITRVLETTDFDVEMVYYVSSW